MKKTKSNFKPKKGLLVFIALFILLYIIIYVVPTVFDIFNQTYVAQYGTLDIKEETECVFVRDEQVYKAPSGGTVDRKAEEGELLRSETLAVTVGNHEQYIEKKGIISYRYDGYENKINTENMTLLKKSFLKEYQEKQGTTKEAISGTAESGDVIFKIIDNSQWCLVYWLSEEDAAIFEEGRGVSVKVDEDVTVKMTVKSITKQGDDVQIILSCNRNYDGFDKHRIKHCTIVASSYSGIILNTDSIVEKDGVKGVFVVDKFNNENFTPIKILSSQGDKTVIEKNYFHDAEGNRVESVQTYSEILKQAKK